MMALNGNGTVYCAIYAGVPVPTVVVVPLSTVPCSVLGLFLVIILSKIMLQVSGSIPYRVKCLVLNLAFVDLLRNMYFIYKAMHQILSLLVGLQHLKVPFGWCIVEQWFLSGTGIIRHISAFIISIDRLVSTVYKQSALYHASHRHNAAKLFAFLFIIWLMSISFYGLITVWSNVHFQDSCFCSSGTLWSTSVNGFLNIFLIIVQISTTIMYLIVYYNNSKKLEKYHVKNITASLNERYRQWGNVKISKWLMPLTLASIVPSATTLIVLTVLLYSAIVVDITSSFDVSVIYVAVYAIDSALFPYLCIRFSPVLRQEVKQRYGRLNGIFAFSKADDQPASSHVSNTSREKIIRGIKNAANLNAARRPTLENNSTGKIGAELHAKMLEQLWIMEEKKIT